jgi:hypothetical protein
MKVTFDPNNPLSDAELDKLGKEDFDAFLDYLDQKSKFLRRPSQDKVSEMKKKKHEILKNNGVKNVKTHRSQWFD